MPTASAGDDTNPQGWLSRSGAMRPLGVARLACRRRFRPSPCPTHDGGRLATVPSADFCPITPDVAALRAVRVAVGSVCGSGGFVPGLSPAPWPPQPP